MDTSIFKSRLTFLQKKITLDRTTYKQFKDWLEQRYPDIWKPVERAISNRANYYKAEEMRAKHALAAYMRGSDSTIRQHDSIVLEILDQELDELINDMKNAQEAAAAADNNPSETNLLLQELAESSVKRTVENIAEKADWLEEITYAGV